MNQYTGNKWTRMHKEHRVKSKRYVDYAQEALQYKTLNREEEEAIKRGMKIWSCPQHKELVDRLSLGI